MKRTKIIATIWPVTANKEKVLELYDAWVNIIRFNFSHATYKEALSSTSIIKDLNASWKTNLSLLLDTKWPEIRTWEVKESIIINEWDVFSLVTDNSVLKWKDLFCNYKHLSEDVDEWGIIVIDSGLLNVKVLKRNNNSVEVKALNSSKIWSKRHVNLPWVKLKLPWMTTKDKEDILWWIKNDFSFIAASFIRSADNVQQIRDLLDQNWWWHIKIISKIENQEWVDNLKEIVKVSDGIMVARWDLWVEVPIQKLALYQKKMIQQCKKKWKFVIVATHMLETMIDNPFPTRAESSDIFNAVLQKPDCLMLSWETTIWSFPIECVELMTSIIVEAEKHIEYNHESFSSKWLSERDIEKKLLIKSWIYIGEELEANALVILTKTWKLAKLASAFRPEIKTYAFTPNNSTVKICNAYFWINPLLLKKWNPENYNKTLETAINLLLKKWYLHKNNKIIAINDIQKEGVEIPVMEIINVGDFI